MKKTFFFKVTWVLIVKLLVLSSCLISTVTLTSQAFEMFRRFKLGYGLTDEAYGISFAIDQGKNPQQGQTPLFADVTSTILRLVNFNIPEFRIVGLVVLIVVALTFFTFHNFVYYKSESFSSKFLNFQIIMFSVLYLSTSFRYLLITPSYQWLVLVGTITIVVLLVAESRINHPILRNALIIISASQIFIVYLGRPVSGVLIWGITNCYFLFKYKRKSATQVLQLNISLFVFTALHTIFSSGANFEYLLLYWQLRKIDPTGSTLILEIWDVTRSAMSVALTLLLAIWFSSKVLLVSKISKQKRFKFVFQSILYLLTNLLVLKSFPFRDVEHLVALLALSLIGFAYGLRFGSKVDYLLLFISLSPILTQFGSNTNASYLISPYLLVGVLFIYLSAGAGIDNLSSQSLVMFRKVISAFAWLTISLCLLFLQHSSEKTTYEVELPISKLKWDAQNSLYYSERKLESINQFRENASVTGAYSGERIIDFSFWHPGAILYLGGIQYPISIADKTFEKTLETQLDLVFKHINSWQQFSQSPIIVRTSASKPLNRCDKLTNQISDFNLRSALGARDFNPNVRDVSIYRSLPIDTTLYPYNIALLVPC